MVFPGAWCWVQTFNISVSDLDDGTVYNHSKSAEDTKLGGVVDPPDDCAAI